MSIQQEKFRNRATAFMRELMSAYLEKRDFTAVENMLHPELTLVSLTAKDMLKKEWLSGMVCFQIPEQYYEAKVLDEEKCLVWGNIKVQYKDASLNDITMNLRISAVCIYENERFLLYHIHYSLPDFAWQMGDFLPEKLVDHIVGGVEICSMDDDFTIEYVNNGFCQLTGYTKEELLGTPHINMVFQEDIYRLREEVSSGCAFHEQFSVEYRIMHKNGSYIWVLDKGAVFLQDGKPNKIQCTLTDITLRKEQEEERRIDAIRYSIVLQQLDVDTFEYNIVTGQLILFEHDTDLFAVPAVLEHGPETLIQMGVIRPDYVDGYREMYRKIHAGEPYAYCFINSRDKDHVIHEYELSLTTIFDINHKPIRAIGIKKDVSQILRLQRAQKFSETMMHDKTFVFEANMTTNTVLYADPEWLPEGISPNQPLDQVVFSITEVVVEPEYRGHVIKQLSTSYICQVYKEGVQLLTFSYKRLAENHQYQWYEATVNIVEDEYSGNIGIRMYNTNINERKGKEQNAEKERMLYESMVAKAIQAYEFNLTRDIFVKGFESWKELYDIDVNSSYSNLIARFCNMAIHPEDRSGFLTAMSRTVLIQAFHEKQNHQTCQYRKQNRKEEMRWVTCTTHLYEDPDSGEIRGYCYVEDIDKKKREELALKYRAEHDFLTGLYNKETCTLMMEKVLQNSNVARDIHALMVIDIDHFKNVNDSLGHLFGDRAISEIGSTISSVFRSSDVVGRVGGDEFCVLLTNIGSSGNALQKAQQICDNLRHTYSKDDVKCHVSASVGIALYPRNGDTFEKLFQQADRSLYVAKYRGRNRYVWYEFTD